MRALKSTEGAPDQSTPEGLPPELIAWNRLSGGATQITEPWKGVKRES
jgi:hypothetical protein